ncbi:MAG: cytochrome c oxidase assembly protein [Lentimonas sp.]
MQLHWHTEPLLLISLLLVGWLYALGTGPLRGKISPTAKYPWAKAVLFYSGLIITYLAVGSPLDQIGEQFLFSAHMVQHMLLVYFSTTLFIYGTPSWLIDHLLKPEGVRKVMSVLTHPACGGLLFTVIYTAWHVPGLYELALRDKRMHILEHWTMFGLALFMLWPYLTLSKRVPRRSFGIRMVGMFLLMVGQLPVFAFLTLAGEAIYPTYIWAPRIINLDPINDQILGGIIMKVINMGFSLTILGTAFYAWSKSEAAESDPSPKKASSTQ